jgi:hypothetical protein
VRQVGTQWRVDPILGVGDYAFRPAEGATVGSRPTFTAQFDPGVVARVWFDGTEGVATSTTTFRSQQVLAPGWHVVTAVLQRGRDVVARTVDLEVVG